jgi:hypothetical protein
MQLSKCLSSFIAAVFFGLVLAASDAAQAQTVVATPGQTVSTGANGKQILFRDKTSITAGADSTITVKRAQYDANGTANVVIDVSKGAFRYITGDTAGSHTVKTPLSTVGVRGTVIEGFVDVNGYEVFALMEGAFEVCTTAGCQQVTSPGTFVVVYPNGQISPPAGIPTAMMNAMLLRWPSVDLVNQYLFETTNTGGDPLVRFRDLNEIQNGQSATPPPPPGGGDTGGDDGENPYESELSKKICKGKPRSGQTHDCRRLFDSD